MMNSLKKTKNIAIWLLVLNLVFVGTYWIFSRKIAENNNQLLSLAEELNIQLNREKQLKSLKSIVAETEEDRKRLNSFFVSKEGIVSFISQIESIADLSGGSIEIDSVGVGPFEEEGAPKSEILEILSMNITSLGSWSDNFYFLNLLETMPFKVSIKRFSLEKEISKTESNDNWEGFFEIEIFKKK